MHPELNPMTADNSPQTFNSLVVYALSVQQNFLTGMLISVDSSEKLSIESIRKYGVYPRRVRADMGAENVHVETIRKFLRRIHGDEHASEQYSHGFLFHILKVYHIRRYARLSLDLY
jgi:hypothetical protein